MRRFSPASRCLLSRRRAFHKFRLLAFLPAWPAGFFCGAIPLLLLLPSLAHRHVFLANLRQRRLYSDTLLPCQVHPEMFFVCLPAFFRVCRNSLQEYGLLLCFDVETLLCALQYSAIDISCLYRYPTSPSPAHTQGFSASLARGLFPTMAHGQLQPSLQRCRILQTPT